MTETKREKRHKWGGPTMQQCMRPDCPWMWKAAAQMYGPPLYSRDSGGTWVPMSKTPPCEGKS